MMQQIFLIIISCSCFFLPPSRVHSMAKTNTIQLRRSERLKEKYCPPQTPSGFKPTPHSGSPGDTDAQKIHPLKPTHPQKLLPLKQQLLEIEQLRVNKTELETYQTSVQILFRQLCLAFYFCIQIQYCPYQKIPGTDCCPLHIIIDRMCEIIPYMPIKLPPKNSNPQECLLLIAAHINIVLREYTHISPEVETDPGTPPKPTPIYFAPKADEYNPLVMTEKEDFSIFQIDKIYFRNLSVAEEDEKARTATTHYPALIEHIMVLNLKLISKSMEIFWHGLAVIKLLPKNLYTIKMLDEGMKFSTTRIVSFFSKLAQTTQQPDFDSALIIPIFSHMIDNFYLNGLE